MPTRLKSGRWTRPAAGAGRSRSDVRAGGDPGVVRVIVADPEAVDRAALASLIDSHPSFRVVAKTESVQDTLAQIRELDPDVVVVTVTLPTVEGGPVCTELLTEVPDLRIVALSERGWDRCLVLNPPGPSSLPIVPSRSACEGSTDCLHLAAAQGALGTVRRSADPDILFAAIRDVAAGVPHLEPGTAEVLASMAGEGGGGSAPLSPRELEVAALIARGQSNKEISTSLGISEGTVKKHVGHALTKLGLLDRLQLGLHVARNPLLLKGPDPGVPGRARPARSR